MERFYNMITSFIYRSQMDNLQVRGLRNQTARPNASNPGLGLQDQTARPNASNPGPDTSLQSQIRGLNTQQLRSLTELS
jgi:hypothetical protein